MGSGVSMNGGTFVEGSSILRKKSLADIKDRQKKARENGDALELAKCDNQLKEVAWIHNLKPVKLSSKTPDCDIEENGHLITSCKYGERTFIAEREINRQLDYWEIEWVEADYMWGCGAMCGVSPQESLVNDGCIGDPQHSRTGTGIFTFFQVKHNGRSDWTYYNDRNGIKPHDVIGCLILKGWLTLYHNGRRMNSYKLEPVEALNGHEYHPAFMVKNKKHTLRILDSTNDLRYIPLIPKDVWDDGDETLNN